MIKLYSWLRNLLSGIKQGRRDLILISLNYLTHQCYFLLRIFLTQTSFRISGKRSFPYVKKRILSKYINLPEPVNLQKKDAPHFGVKRMAVHEMRLLEEKDCYVFISQYHGVTFHNFTVNTSSIHTIAGDRAGDVFSAFPNMVYHNLYASILANNIMFLDTDKHYVLVHNWFNYYHWLTETLPRIWVARQKLRSDFVLLLPEALSNVSFVTQSLCLFPELPVEYIPSKINTLLVKNLILVEQKPYCEEYDPDVFSGLITHIKSKLNIKKLTPGTQKLYISRKLAGRRTLSNEDAVVEVFKKFNYTILYAEELSFTNQVELFSEARVVASLHGAGLTNMMWMPPGGTVLELHREIKKTSDHHSFVYFTLAAALSHRYFYQWCYQDNNSDFFEGVLSIDLILLEKTLKQIE